MVNDEEICIKETKSCNFDDCDPAVSHSWHQMCEEKRKQNYDTYSEFRPLLIGEKLSRSLGKSQSVKDVDEHPLPLKKQSKILRLLHSYIFIQSLKPLPLFGTSAGSMDPILP